MIPRNTVFVLGAGASQPYGFPTGGELLAEISAMPDEWWPIADSLAWDHDDHKELLNYIAMSGVYSLDAIARHVPEIGAYAKGVTAYKIGMKEKQSGLLGCHVDLDWLRFLHDLMFNTPSGVDNLDPIPLSVITFNYDRSFENATAIRAKHRYGAHARRKLAGISVLHVHGTLGSLQVWDGAQEHLPYGGTMDSERVEKTAANIKFIHEQDANSSEFRQAQAILQNAQVVVFLGCAMHKENLARLNPSTWAIGDQRTVYVSTYGMQLGQIEKTRRALGHGDRVGLLDNHHKALAALKQIEHEFSD